jgi:acyl carrier protein
MLESITATTLGRVRRLVDAILVQQDSKAAVADDDRLVDAGLASMDMVNLMLAVETEFDIMIPAGDITPQNFRSIGTVAAMVDRVVEANAA